MSVTYPYPDPTSDVQNQFVQEWLRAWHRQFAQGDEDQAEQAVQRAIEAIGSTRTRDLRAEAPYCERHGHSWHHGADGELVCRRCAVAHPAEAPLPKAGQARALLRDAQPGDLLELTYLQQSGNYRWYQWSMAARFVGIDDKRGRVVLSGRPEFGTTDLPLEHIVRVMPASAVQHPRRATGAVPAPGKAVRHG